MKEINTKKFFDNEIKNEKTYLAKISYSPYDPNNDDFDNQEIEIKREINGETLKQLLIIISDVDNNLRNFDIRDWVFKNNEKTEKLLEIINYIIDFINSEISDKDEVHIILLSVNYEEIKEKN